MKGSIRDSGRRKVGLVLGRYKGRVLMLEEENTVMWFVWNVCVEESVW